jgi:prepilin-type N-terminal cleavage/methylation domain-containing protein
MVTASDRGFSLVELLVAMVVAIFVVGGATMLGSQMQSSYRGQMESANAQQEGRFAIEWIERYLRAAGNNPYRLLTTPCPIAGTPVQAIRFDPDGDGSNDDIRLQTDSSPSNGLLAGTAGACDEAGEDVVIAHDGANRTITLTDVGTGGGAEARTDGVIQGLEFVYRDAAHAVTANPDAVAFVETRVTVRSKIDDQNLAAPITSVVQSEVRVRAR